MFLATHPFGDSLMRVGIKGVRRLLEKTGLVFCAFDSRRVCGSALIFVFSLMIFSSCTNIKFADRKPSSEVFFPDQSVLNGASFTLNSILVDPNPNFAGSIYNVIGQNGEFDNYCGGNFGDCTCIYTYTIGTNVNQIVESQVVYQESNMLRCPNSVPSGASSFSIKIQTQAGNGGGPYVSNSLTVNLGAGGTFQDSAVYADLTDERSYQQVRRYQCRKNEFIPSLFDSAFLDPIQSQDPRVIYPFNFYTSNVGESILALQRNITSAGWECTLSPTFDYSPHWWANPMVFSNAPCNSNFCVGDGELIYPANSLESGRIPASFGSTANGKRRSSFAVLPRPFGVFNIPIIAATAPRNYVSAYYSGEVVDDLTLSPLGYAAQPVVAPGGGSSCPNIPIPPNARWVKLWNFRATDLEPPRRVQSTIATREFPIACLSSVPDDLFDSCYFFDAPAANTPTGSRFLPVSDATGASTMASRVALMNTSGSGGGRDPSACYNIEPDWDTFRASRFAFSFAGNIPEQLNIFKSYPWGLYSLISTTVSFPAGVTTPDPPPWMIASNPTAIPIDTVGNADTVPLSPDLYSDHLFVITDPSVRISDFQNLNSDESNNFRPVTYRTRGACTGPSRANCSQDQVNWELNTKNINQPLGPEVYPLCVLQFSD
ncbi:MAG: hypothetical protein KGP28_11090 [Bdellovibrionales bacterium]|nr:hypothetical protein [Bdellovibrionales bacterium]